MTEKNEHDRPRYGEKAPSPALPSRQIRPQAPSLDMEEDEWQRFLEYRKQRHDFHLTWAYATPILVIFAAGAAWVVRWALGLL